MKVLVRAVNGESHEIQVDPKQTTISVKGAVEEIFNTKSKLKKENQKLVYNGRLLENESTLLQEGVQEGGILVCMATRKPRNPPPVDPTPVPTKDIIFSFTSYGQPPGKKPARTPRNSSSVSQLRNHLQELMGTLIGIPTTISMEGEMELESENNERQNENEAPQNEAEQSPEPATTEPVQLPPVDPVALQQFTEMGFTEARSSKALILNGMNTRAAMDWLLQHSDDPHVDDPIPQRILKRIAKKNNSFTPDPEAVKKLQDMGFPNEEVVAALRANGNNFNAACAWLLGERDTEEATFTLEDPQMLQTVLSNPVVQSGLSNPRVMQALRSMIENPGTSHQYMGDPEVAPVLAQVVRLLNNLS